MNQKSKRRTRFIPPLLIAWFIFFTLACNLTDSGPPPTVVPRATPLPPATLGFTTLSPDELPEQAATESPAFDADLFNLINEIQADRMLFHIDSLQSFHTRHVNSPQDRDDYGIGAAQRYIEGQFEAMRARSNSRLYVFPHHFPLNYNGISTRQTNVVAVLPGTEPGAGVILIGAHYDSRALNLQDAEAYAPGANDNASGVAAVLEIARALSSREHRATLMFVAFSAEEVGRTGSIAFVNDYIKGRDIPLVAMINLDIIGSETGADGSINYQQIDVFSADPNTSISRRLARDMNFIGFNQGLEMEILVQNREDRPASFGDHSSFSNEGYAAVRFTETNEEPQRRHTDRDTIGDIQARYLTRATQSILATTYALASGPRPPVNISLRDSGGSTRTLVWEAVDGATGYIVALRRPGSLIYDQQFEVNTNSVEWDGFNPNRFEGVAIAVRDRRGLIGRPSAEVTIR